MLEFSGAIMLEPVNGKASTRRPAACVRAPRGWWRGIAGVAFMAFVSAGIVVAYVFAVGRLSSGPARMSPAERAVLAAVDELSQVTVDSAAFGTVGLVDRPADEPGGPVLSANSLVSLMVSEWGLRGATGAKAIDRIVEADARRTAQALSSLNGRLLESAQGSGAPEKTGEGPVYNRCRTVLSHELAQGGETLVSMSVELGGLSPGAGRTCLVAPPGLWAKGADLVAPDRTYRPAVRIQAGSESFSFVSAFEKPCAVDPLKFRKLAAGQTPSALLLTCQSRRADGEIVRRTSCAVVGSAAVKPRRLALTVGFPDGGPAGLDSLNSLVESSRWRAGASWQQVLGGEVPGTGSLSPLPAPGARDIDPGAALAEALIGWFRAAGPGGDPQRFLRVLAFNWARDPAYSGGLPPGRGQPLNSCLLRDTGAREFALANQAGPGGAGQRAIGGLLSGPRRACPRQALPLAVDARGRVSLPGRKTFDPLLVASYFSALHETNLAGLEGRAVAERALRRLQGEDEEIGRELVVLAEQVKSLKRRMPPGPAASDTEAEISPPVAGELARLNERLETLIRRRSRLVSRRDRLYAARSNAEQAAYTSFDLCNRASQFLSAGLCRASRQPEQYLVGERLLFSPHRQSLRQEDVDALAETDEPGQCPWFAPAFETSRRLSLEAAAEIRRASPDCTAAGGSDAASPFFVEFDSLCLFSSRSSPGRRVERAPAGADRLKPGVLFYYCPAALVTGTSPPVSWSAMCVDACRRLQASGLSGQAPAGASLAVEFQVRAPLPDSSKIPFGLVLTEPFTGETASPLPPVPPSML